MMNTSTAAATDVSEFDIAIVSMQCRFPGAKNTDEFWHNLKHGVESIAPLTEEELGEAGVCRETYSQDHYVKAGSYIEDHDWFDADFFGYSAREAAFMDPQHRIFLELCWNALELAGCDPNQYDGAIGVFAGATYNSYLLNNLLNGRNLKDTADRFFVQILNDKDNLATRVSYKLNLKGPSLSIQTACSTSLVSVHFACQSLLSQECDMALAGGVTVRSPQKSGYEYQPDMILSKDGHCRPFDSQSSGTVFGSGAGVVVLKRLSDAIRDGNCIHAIIKGSSVNNDGAEKIGYTAPGRRGQEQVLASALAISGVPVESISAIEAHGTATAMGDPIEFESIKKIYGATDRSVAVGSVKGNIGHLECAAGIASLIKMTLCLKHKTLVPSINYVNPNPHLDIENTPFFINTETRPWNPQDDQSLRCAVSSFGIGGTNAHIVLEEGWPAPAPNNKEQDDLFVFSAKNRVALKTVMSNVGSFLSEHKHADLASVAQTLRTGRKGMEYRCAVAAPDRVSLIKRLGEDNFVFPKSKSSSKVVFAFPGQGTQYIHMAKSIYQTVQNFHEIIDHAANVLSAHLGMDMRDIIFPAAGSEAWAKEMIEDTKVTQAILFSLEYALARLWCDCGVQPEALIGHSLGEYTAACLSGVFSFEDGLKLVAKRGELISSLPKGSMLAVVSEERAIESILPGELSIAAVNGPTFVVVSGPTEAVNRFDEILHQKKIDCRHLHTSHAFHSRMMEPIYDDYLTFVKNIQLSAPRIPYVSNVTGGWITAEEATSPTYWATHILKSVRFSDGISKLLPDVSNIYLEVGPGSTLGTFIKNHSVQARVIASMPHANDDTDSLPYLHNAIGKLWESGVNISWHLFERGQRFIKTELPATPFQRKRFWIEESADNAPIGMENIVLETTLSPDDILGETEEKRLPRDDVEKDVHNIFATVLGVSAVDIRDNFFELGGHSLLAIQLLTRINKKYQVKLELNDFIKFSSVQGVSDEIKQRGYFCKEEVEVDMGLPAIVEELEKRCEPFPLTEMQEAQWLGRISSFSGGNVAAHIYFETDKENIDLDRLQTSWQAMVDRHEMLRTVLLPTGGQQILNGHLDYRIRNCDLRDKGDEDAQSMAMAIRGEMDHNVRAIDQWPLFEVRTTQLPGNLVRLHFSIDLLICDVGSVRILQRDWAYAYDHPEQELPKLELSFRDYVLTESKLKTTDLYQKANDYWDNKVKTLPLTTAPELPLVKMIDDVESAKFKRWSFVIGKSQWEKIKSSAVRHSLSPSTVIMTAFAFILSTWSKSKEFCINTPIINRLPLHPQVKQLVGEFASFAPVSISLQNNKTFLEVAEDIQGESWKNLENRFVSGTSILRKLAKHRGGTSGAVFPVVFTSTIVQSVQGEEKFHERFGEYTYLISQTPQVWLDHTAMETKEGLLLSWHALPEMFQNGVLDAMWNAYEVLMNRLADNESEWTLPSLSVLPEADAEIQRQANETQREMTYGLLHENCLRMAERYPSKPAIVTSSREITYAQMRNGSGIICDRLKAIPIQKSEIVAVVMDKGYEQILSVLGILQSGGAYLPLDADLPKDRLTYILKCSQTHVVLTQQKHFDSIRWLEDEGYIVMTVTESLLDTTQVFEELVPVQGLDDLAYVIFTSGSTGNPKGVMITHRAAQNTILDINEKFSVGESDRCFALSELNFDLSVYDVFGLLSVGGTVVIPDAGTSRDPEHWLELLLRHSVTMWNSVPALAAMLLEFAQAKGKKLPLRLVMMSGDWIPIDLPKKIWQSTTDAQVISLGGATEAAIWSIYYPIRDMDENWASIPYGKPLSNQTFHVLKQDLSPCPIWTAGELYIGGAGLAQGYINEPELSKRAFICHPITKERLYKTGDIGRYWPDGNIEFLGREDFQVKISGFRVELEEIEAALLKYPHVKAVAVDAKGRSKENKRLIAYVVLEESSEFAPDKLEIFLADSLPGYMIPQEYVVLDSMPLSANGKVDRKALPEPKAAIKAVSDIDFATDSTTMTLIPIFAEVIKLSEKEVDIHANFFSLGGDSISGIQIISKAAKSGIEITPQMFFEHTTIAELVQALHKNMGSKDDVKKAIPLTKYQQQLLALHNENAVTKNRHVLILLDRYVSPEDFEKAFQRILSIYPVLNAGFVRTDRKWTSILDSGGAKAEIDYASVNVTNQAETAALMESVKADLIRQQSLDKAPLVKLCLFDDEENRTQYLLLVWNDLVMDTRSVVLFLEALDQDYRRLTSGDYSTGQTDTKQVSDWLRYDRHAEDGKGLSRHCPDLQSDFSIVPEKKMTDIHFEFPYTQEIKRAADRGRLQTEELYALAYVCTINSVFDTKRFSIDCVYDRGREELRKNQFEHVIGQLAHAFTLSMDFTETQILDALIRDFKSSLNSCQSWSEDYDNKAQGHRLDAKLKFSCCDFSKMPSEFSILDTGCSDEPEYSLVEMHLIQEPNAVKAKMRCDNAVLGKMEVFTESFMQMIAELTSYLGSAKDQPIVQSDFIDSEWVGADFATFLELVSKL